MLWLISRKISPFVCPSITFRNSAQAAQTTLRGAPTSTGGRQSFEQETVHKTNIHQTVQREKETGSKEEHPYKQECASEEGGTAEPGKASLSKGCGQLAPSVLTGTA